MSKVEGNINRLLHELKKFIHWHVYTKDTTVILTQYLEILVNEDTYSVKYVSDTNETNTITYKAEKLHHLIEWIKGYFRKRHINIDQVDMSSKIDKIIQYQEELSRILLKCFANEELLKGDVSIGNVIDNKLDGILRRHKTINQLLSTALENMNSKSQHTPSTNTIE